MGKNSANSKGMWGIDENGQYTQEYLDAVNKMYSDPEVMKKAIADLSYTGYNLKTPDDFKRLATDGNPKEVHQYVRQHLTSTTPKATGVDYWGTYIDRIGNLKKIKKSEFYENLKKDPKFGSKFEADGPVEGSERPLENYESHKPQVTKSFYDMPKQNYDQKTDSFYYPITQNQKL